MRSISGNRSQVKVGPEATQMDAARRPEPERLEPMKTVIGLLARDREALFRVITYLAQDEDVINHSSMDYLNFFGR